MGGASFECCGRNDFGLRVRSFIRFALIYFVVIIMGNTVNQVSDAIHKDYEHKSGKRLLRAIQANVASQVQEAVDTARKELLSKDRTRSHDEDFNNYVKKMTYYLTREYQVGESLLFGGKTPLEVAESLHADQAIKVIKENLEILSRNNVSADILENKHIVVRESPTLGKIDKDRATLARERLKEMQRKHNETKK
ncbi:hypothetical protein EON65_06125 [archaeon]|nr:MAG: hypothetical protein EON65_06125 [archaeon]